MLFSLVVPMGTFSVENLFAVQIPGQLFQEQKSFLSKIIDIFPS